MERKVYEFISKQTNDPIVEWKTCKVSGKEFPVFQSDLDFYEKISPTFAGKKFQIPTPTLCPEERMRRRLIRRNDRKLYRRECDATGENIISIYSPDKPYKVYDQKSRRSDNRDPMKYGRDFDFTKSFTQQFDALLKEVPALSLLVKMNENCEYVNACGNSKNCYLIFDSDFCEDSMYSSIIKHCKDTIDGLHVYFCEKTYNCVNCTESYHLLNCYECDRSKFLTNCSKCSGCEFCYNCANLVNQKYCIDNKQYSKEEYEKLLSQKKFNYNYAPSLMRMNYTVNDEGGMGNNLYGCKNTKISYNMGYTEDMKYCDLVTGADNCYDVSSYGGELSWSYEGCSIGSQTSKIYFSSVITSGIHDVYYCHVIGGGNNLFGCVGLKNKEYCIFNKQYTKAEYEKILPQIIQHMVTTGERGEFPDASVSQFGYNETIAQEYFPMTREEALARGYKRQDNNYDPVIPQGAETWKGNQIPTDISTVPDDVLQKIFICEISGRPFRIVKAELEFYRRHGIPLPRRHPDIRHLQRLAQTPERNLYLRKCDKCQQEKLSVISPKIDAKVYCESCYTKEIYG